MVALLEKPMYSLVFYEKPGCTNNRRQRRLLEGQGCVLERRNLLTEAWSKASLAPFFTEHREISDWFNRRSPRVKSGEINPKLLSVDEALDLMIADPLLIRRPLIAYDIDDEIFRCSGFDYQKLNLNIGFNLALSLGRAADSPGLAWENIEECPKPHLANGCEDSVEQTA